MKIIFIVLLVGLALVYTHPFLQAGFFSTHDGEWAVVRLTEMWREVRDLQIPPRWSDYLNHGYGYPLFNFTYPFPYYLGLVLKLAGFGYVTSIKVLFILSVVFSGLGMYLLGKELHSRIAGFVAAIFYITSPFRLVDLYVRGSLGESLSLALFPFLFYFSVLYLRRRNRLLMVVCAILFSILVLTHNIMAILFAPLWLVFLLIVSQRHAKQEKIPFMTYLLKYIAPMLVLGLGCCAYFFLPAIAEKKDILLSQVDLASVEENFISPDEFVSTFWSFSGKPSFMIGVSHIFICLVSIISLRSLKNIDHYRPFILYSALSIGVLVFFTQSQSRLLWSLPPLSWVDFPWRLMTILTFFISFLSIFSVMHTRTKVLAIICAIAACIVNFQYVRPADHIEKSDEYYMTNDATTTSMDELMPLWVKDKPLKRYETKVEVLQGRSSISDISFSSSKVSFKVDTAPPSKIMINTIYYPGWEFSLGKSRLDVNYDNPHGVMTVDIPEGSHTVQGVFRETPLRLLANTLTLASLGYIGWIVVKDGRKVRRYA